MVKKQYLLAIIIIAIIVGGASWHLMRQRVGITRIASDTTISGDYVIEKGKKVILRNGSTLTVAGNLIVRGELNCENGPLNVVVNGDAVIENKLECDRGEELKEGDIGAGISIVVKNSFTLTEEAKIITNGHIQIVESADSLAKTQEKIADLYEEAARDTGEGHRLGPFIQREEASNLPQPERAKMTISSEASSRENSFFSLFKIPQAQAEGRMVNLKGEVRVKTPPRGVNLIVVMRFPNITGFNFVKFWLIGPDGRNGRDDTNKSCDAKGEDGQNAMRLLVQAPNIKISDFTLELGSGGSGGNAETKKDCDPGKATGGQGGKAGNFKMIASESFDIVGEFTIYPGRGGDGGGAEAYGKDGEPTKDGGDATAIGGDAEDNEKAVRALGTISGKKNISFGSMEGGLGGSALAVPGDGGDGRACKSEKGGDGGKGVAEGGDGGSALIFLTGTGAQRTKDAQDVGGDGGFVQIIAAKGGNGSNCGPDKAGGDGGRGGDAKATPGKGGIGGTVNGKDGEIVDETGGDGGNGGDGCPEGKGGLGGNGNPAGEKGKDGKNICPIPEKGAVTIHLDPPVITFEHQIGFSPCPQLAGTVQITKTGDEGVNSWQTVNGLPNWLSLETSGVVPGSVNVNFSCLLDQYITQTLSTSLKFQLFDQAGNPVGEQAPLNVTGYISGE